MNTPLPRATRVGDLVLSWRVMLVATWCGAFFAYAAVWQASVQIGIGTWWIGPRAQPAPALVRLLPFLLALGCALAVIYNVRRLLAVSFAGVALATAIAIPDFSRSTGLAVAELVIPVLVALVTAAASTGRYRLAPAGTRPLPVPTETGLPDAPAGEWAPPAQARAARNDD